MKESYAFLIPAGGIGSRVYPLTKEYPKPYLPIYITEDNKIIRLIDLPLNFCKKNNIPVYIALDYKKEKLKYLEDYENVKIIYTNYKELSQAVLALLKEANLDNLKYYSVYAADFLIPVDIIKNMINSIDDNTETVALCTKSNNYSKVKIKSNNGKLDYNEGENVVDLTFHIGRVDRGIRCFGNIINRNINNIWEYLYPKNNEKDWNKAKLLITSVNHIDVGLPNSYYEAVLKLNEKNIDNNGNIVFPGARINCNSKNIIALPNSDSSNIILENCIVPEGAIIDKYDDVLNVELNKKTYFKEIKINNFM